MFPTPKLILAGRGDQIANYARALLKHSFYHRAWWLCAQRRDFRSAAVYEKFADECRDEIIALRAMLSLRNGGNAMPLYHEAYNIWRNSGYELQTYLDLMTK